MKTETPFQSKRLESVFWPLLAMVAALIVWAIYHPGDSTAVEQGESIGFTLCVLAWSLTASLVYSLVTNGPRDWRRPKRWLDGLPVVLACWVFLSGFVNAGVFTSSLPVIGGDLRSAMNEGWWWLAAAGYFVVSRRLVARSDASFAMTGLLIASGILLAAHTLHQGYISLPQTTREYFLDPNGHFDQLGMDAPEGSAARMIFENRLRDGGPTATFALANSLAGPLAMIAAACVAVLFELRGSFRSHRAFAAMTLIALLLVVTALAMTGSRSGVLSLVVAGLYVTLRAFSSGRWRLRRKVPMAIGGVVVLVIAFVFLAGDRASWAQAPATIQLRLQYWSSTLAMVWDHPWFGVGPGNFQLAYQVYRDVRAHELIAEPHDFGMETLACGGFVAASLLSCWLILIAMFAGKGEQSETTEQTTCDVSRFLPAVIAVSVGAFIGLMVVWYSGVVGGMIPDFEAHQFAIPLAIAFLAGWFGLARPVFRSVSWQSIGLVAFATGLVHLCFTGGWTIPGVSLVLLTFLAMALSKRSDLVTQGGLRFSWLWLMFFAASVAMIAALWITAVRPIAASAEAMEQAGKALSRNRPATAEKILRASLVVDPLAIDSAIWLASIEHRRRITDLIEGSVSNSSDTVFDEAVSRIGNDPSRLIVIVQWYLHRYQVRGRVEDLNAAAKLMTRIIELSPTHQGFMAQAAEIAREQSRLQTTPLGDPVALAERADFLSHAGGVITRVLDLQLILPAEQLPPEANGPIRKPASDVLRPLLTNASRNPEDDR